LHFQFIDSTIIISAEKQATITAKQTAQRRTERVLLASITDK